MRDEWARIVTEAWRGSRRSDRRLVEVADGADLTDRSARGIVNGDHIAVVHDLRMGQALFAGDRHLEGDVGAGLQQR